MSEPHVPPQLPEPIAGLAGIATNLFWSWSREARALFRALDPVLWHATRHNPVELLQRVDPARLEACARDPAFLGRYRTVLEQLERHLASRNTWFATRYPDWPGGPIAYFCAEFGLHNSIPIYSGGLGVLAGDFCKAASDLGIPVVGVGLLYTRGYFDQHVRNDGYQEASEDRLDPGVTPLSPVLGPGGEPFLTTVVCQDRTIHVGAWRVLVGRVPIYLLDTDLESNDPADRELSHRLYAGGPDLRLRQEWVLGVGGVRVLRAVGISPVVWHANEGHAAFMFIERLRELVEGGLPYAEAVRQVRSTSVFTTHTPVPAGHDVFGLEQLARCTGPLWDRLGVDRETFFRLAYHPTRDGASFHMTAMAIRLSRYVNGVSRRHGQETRRIWQALWPGRDPDRVPIGEVTNGVHVATWMAHPLKELLDQHLGEGWMERMDDPEVWDRVLGLDDQALWSVHVRFKAQLMDFIHEESRLRWRDYWKDAPHLVGAGTMLTARDLTIGFARRFATYKRADLVFRDPDRLRRILVNPRRPVQIVFAGKAHPADEPGKQMLQRVYAYTRDLGFEGRIAFLEDYELHLAHRLVQGVDLWLNLPRPPMEACGTSGIKAALNGIPQLGTADGWWAEGYTGMNGWLIPAPPDGADGDQFDAEQVYRLLEEEVVPLFYDRDDRGVPVGWVQRMKHALHVAGRQFTASRAMREYVERYYAPAARGDPTPDDPPLA
jgi:starch phosphorylase